MTSPNVAFGLLGPNLSSLTADLPTTYRDVFPGIQGRAVYHAQGSSANGVAPAERLGLKDQTGPAFQPKVAYPHPYPPPGVLADSAPPREVCGGRKHREGGSGDRAGR